MPFIKTWLDLIILSKLKSEKDKLSSDTAYIRNLKHDRRGWEGGSRRR